MKILNAKEEKKMLNELDRLHLKKYFYNEIKIENVHLMLLNQLVKSKIFSKNSIYVAPGTLWAAMKVGKRDDSHNFHGLSPQIIYHAILGIKKATAIYRNKKYRNRFVVVTPVAYKDNTHIIVVIEIGARLVNNVNANINKLVTIYPKDKISLLNNELLYKR